MPAQKLKDILDNGGAPAQVMSVLQMMGFGKMAHPVRGKAVTQTAGASADLINLLNIVSAASPLPRAREGGNVQVRAGGTSATSQLWRIGGCMSIAVPTAGLTVAGADGDGGITITPKAGYTVRYAQYTPGVNEANVLTRRLLAMDDANFPIKEFILRIKTTDGSTVDAAETATSVAATLNGNATFAKYALAVATGTGASLVAAQGATVRGILPVVTGALCALTYDGSRLIFPTTVTDAILYYEGGPDWDLENVNYGEQTPAR